MGLHDGHRQRMKERFARHGLDSFAEHEVLEMCIRDRMNKGGGSEAFGRWAKKHVHTRCGAQLLTMLLGVLIFIDDYFNCLTVGAVMRPVTESHHISRAKLALSLIHI